MELNIKSLSPLLLLPLDRLSMSTPHPENLPETETAPKEDVDDFLWPRASVTRPENGPLPGISIQYSKREPGCGHAVGQDASEIEHKDSGGDAAILGPLAAGQLFRPGLIQLFAACCLRQHLVDIWLRCGLHFVSLPRP